MNDSVLFFLFGFLSSLIFIYGGGRYIYLIRCRRVYHFYTMVEFVDVVSKANILSPQYEEKKSIQKSNYKYKPSVCAIICSKGSPYVFFFFRTFSPHSFFTLLRPHLYIYVVSSIACSSFFLPLLIFFC